MPNERSKYDTDPLDPDFVRRTEELRGATRDVRRTPNEQARASEDADAPTRLFHDSRTPTPQPFAPANGHTNAPPSVTADIPHTYHTTNIHADAPHDSTLRRPFAEQQQQPPPHALPPSARVVPGVGLPENLLAIAPYAPFFIGAVAALVELLLVPRSERKTRFHAAQGLALHGAVLGIALFLRMARMLADFSFGSIASVLLWFVWFGFFIASTIFFVRAMMRVWGGEPFRVEAADEATKWLDEKITPRK